MAKKVFVHICNLKTNSYYHFIYSADLLFFFSKIVGNPGQGGMKAVLGVKWSTNHSPTERAKFLYISIFNAKKVDGKINYFLLQNQSLQHTSTISHNHGKIWKSNFKLKFLADGIGKYFISFQSKFWFYRDCVGWLMCVVMIDFEAKNN